MLRSTLHPRKLAPGKPVLALCLALTVGCVHRGPTPGLLKLERPRAELGPRPGYLVSQMDDGPLKRRLEVCLDRPARRSSFSIGHRGAPLQFPEHTRESYEAAARMGAGILECDVTFTRDRQLVCRHSQCDLHTTTDILAVPDLAAKCSEPFSPADPETGRPASARCCTSDLTLAEFKRLCGKMDAFDPGAGSVEAFLDGPPGWRTDLYSGCGTLMTHRESIELFEELGVGFTPELKEPLVDMPFDGDFTRRDYAQSLVDEYRAAGVDPRRVFPQSFYLEDVLYWIENEPDFGERAVFLDERMARPGWTATPEDMQGLANQGVRLVAPPLWALLELDEAGSLRASKYARTARQAGLGLLTWTLERSGPLADGGGWYFQSVAPAVDRDGDTFEVLDVLAREVGVLGVFSDWPATTTFYASCLGIP